MSDTVKGDQELLRSEHPPPVAEWEMSRVCVHVGAPLSSIACEFSLLPLQKKGVNSCGRQPGRVCVRSSKEGAQIMRSIVAVCACADHRAHPVSDPAGAASVSSRPGHQNAFWRLIFLHPGTLMMEVNKELAFATKTSLNTRRPATQVIEGIFAPSANKTVVLHHTSMCDVRKHTFLGLGYARKSLELGT
jgi:hypothetical protein